MAVHAAFAKELAGFQNSDDRFLALLGQDSQFDSSFLNVKHRVGDIALLKHVLILMEFQYLLSRAHFGEKNLRVKHVIGWLSHRSLLWLDERHLTSSARACNIYVCCSIEAPRLSHDTGHLCQKSGVSDRHGRSLRAGQSFNLGPELLRERLYDAC